MLRALLLGSLAAVALAPAVSAEPEIRLFFEAASPDDEVAAAALERIAAEWRDEYTILFVDIARLMRPSSQARRQDAVYEGAGGDIAGAIGESAGSMPFDPRGGGAPPLLGDAGSPIRRRLVRFLRKQTGRKFGDDLDRWRRWVWSLPYRPHADYALFKAAVYRNIDERMVRFFPPDAPASVRLDEIDWGGVAVNGVPPLHRPEVVEAAAADWLDDDDVVFGLELGGRARAYPRRIVAWHELVRDELGELPVTLVYCTLCGSVIPYDPRVGDETLVLGTSGLLYRSNKLLFDERTNTLWSAMRGHPVVGPRVSADVALRRYPVVATKWGEWRRLHPDTTVLSIETGFRRDYDEGTAYADYLRTDRLWFEVPETDERLKNKDEVVTLVVGDTPLAVARAFLRERPVFRHRVRGTELWFLTDGSGGTRVYEGNGVELVRWRDAASVEDAAGRVWSLTETGLAAADGGALLPRVASSPAFWFGWRAQHPHTELIR